MTEPDGPARGGGNDLAEVGTYRFWVNEHVRFQDLDPVGHANNNAIGVYLESARVAFLTMIGLKEKGATGNVLAHISIDFRGELHYGDEIKVGLRVMRIGRTSTTFGSAIFCKEQCAATSVAVMVLIDTATRRPSAVPQATRERLSAYL